MIITCEQCLTRFRLADDKVKPGGSRVRCSKCQHVFTVLPAPPPPEDSATGFDDFAIERTGEAAALTSAPVSEPASSPVTAPAFATEGPVEFDFGFETAAAPPEPPAEPTAAVASTTLLPPMDTAPAAAAAGLAIAPETGAEAAGDLAWADGTEEDADRFAFSEESDTAETGGDFTLPGDETWETSSFDVDSVFGRDDESGWGETATDKELPFDFDTPHFADGSEPQPVTRQTEGGPGFGEISFDEPAPDAAATPAPVQPPPPPAVAVPPAPPSQAALRTPPEEPPAGQTGRKPSSRVLRLSLLLLILCAGALFYFAGNGQQFIEQLRQQIAGGETTGMAVEQRIGLSIAGSSYVDNRETGTLLVIQGAATNNFTEPRSAITVKGMLLDAAGKVLQQQTVYCGNYLNEEKLRGMKYAQIEEAMNNQFGDGLANMNVRPGASLRFTIVFRNPPQVLGNINVEVADSKPGGP